MSDDPRALILTLRFDPATAERLGALRRAYFPPTLNIVPAHLTLFHHLPGLERGPVEAAVRRTASGLRPLPLIFSEARSLGRGVALGVASPDLVSLRAALASRFAPWLTRQDQQGFRPHVTIQNKVSPDEARALHRSLSDGFAPWSGLGTGLLLWRYLNGPWALEAEAPFAEG